MVSDPQGNWMRNRCQRRFNSELPETAVTELKIIALRQKTTFSKVLAEAAQEYIRRRPAVAA